ncbi:thiol-disulfide isomerase-like thioredoxin [Thermus thermophilus]|uniref:TlpA disulfide reductase family protein n=1 Tax=Thermus thermophilus TaxID=274 RepID=UPI00090B2A42|nr:TlpA disulfide reductase family protein [Thermus thermophilus]BAW00922.1 thiol-disulfide isomerase-like thioredoxin [Thermus thermophilus]BDB11612.1 thiol:disulfide interchange protein [Thermus thermophilus]
MDALQVGPLAIPWVRVQVALALLALVGVAELLARRVDRRLSPWAQGAILVGLLGARLGFVLENASVYARDPLSVLYVWQGGFDPWWGILAGGGYTLMTLPKHLWRYALGAALVAGLVVGVLFTRQERAGEVRLPAITLTTLGGTQVNLESFRGKPVVLNAWATWCPPCRRELPMMVRLAQENPEVRFAFVSQGEGPLVVKNFLEERGLSPEWVLLDPETRLAQALGVQGLPTTFFFDREGRLVARHLGELSEALLLGYLRVLR